MGYPVFKAKNPESSEPLCYLRKITDSDVTLSKGISEDILETYDKQKFMSMFASVTFEDIWNDIEMKAYLQDTCMMVDGIQMTIKDVYTDKDVLYKEYLDCIKNMLNGGFGEYPGMVNEQVAILELFINNDKNIEFLDYLDNRFDELIKGFDNSDFTDFTEYVYTNGCWQF